jgi:hypothetical protein
MKRGKKMSEEEPVATRDYVKSTYLLPLTLKENLKYIALARGIEQSDLVREILTNLIRDSGLDPAKSPTFVFDKLRQER